MIENDNFVACAICGKQFKSLSLHIQRLHRMEMMDYISKFPDSKLVCQEMNNRRSKWQKNREVWWGEKISKGAKAAWQANPNQGRTGKPLSPESKKALSEKLRGHDVSPDTRKKIGEACKGNPAWNNGLTKHTDSRVLGASRSVTKYLKSRSRELVEAISAKSSNTLKKLYAAGMPVPNSKNGFRADIEMSFRSRWEANYARILRHNGIPIVYEVDRFELFFADNTSSIYVSDFKLPNGELIEIKGHAQSADNWDCSCGRCQRDKKKLCQLKIQFPNIKLTMIGKTEYRALCDQYGSIVPNWEFSYGYEQLK